jgi:hypothetical protein
MALDDLPTEGGSIRGRKATADYAIDPDTGCWNWLKGLNASGYPHGRIYRNYYEIAYGPITPGHHVHHACLNKRCINPEHLGEIDPRDHFWEHKVDAHTGLTLEDIRTIRELGRMRVSARQVAADYGTTHTSVYNYWLGRTWQDRLGDGPVEVVDGVCAECGGPVTGRRDKRFCRPACRRKHNHRKRPRRRQTAAMREERR